MPLNTYQERSSCESHFAFPIRKVLAFPLFYGETVVSLPGAEIRVDSDYKESETLKKLRVKPAFSLY